MASLTIQQIVLFAVIVGACAGIMTELLRLDIAALLIILALYCSGILKSEEALAGFMSEPAIVIVSIFVLGAGIYRTGLANRICGWISRAAGESLPRMLLVLVPAAALMSAFTHHVTITAVLLPVALSLARQRSMAASQLLMPMAIGSSLGTTATVIAAPSYLVASQLLQQAGRPGLSVFSVTPIGIPLVIAGAVYMVLFGNWLLPRRKGAEDPSERFKLDRYLTELHIPEGSRLAGKKLSDIRKLPHYQFDVVGWLREGRKLQAAGSRRQVRQGDVLLVQAAPEDLLAIRDEERIELKPSEQYGEPSNGHGQKQPKQAQKDGGETNDELVQAVIAPGSSLIGRTLRDAEFRSRYGAVVLGIWRREHLAPQEIAGTRLRAGDVLVLDADDDTARRIAEDRDFLMTMAFQGEAQQPRKELLAAVIMIGTIVVAGARVLPLSLATLAGATTMVVARCITPRQAYRAIDQRMYIFIAGAIPLGTAMSKTGAAKLLAGMLHGVTASWNVALILFALFILIGIVVQFMGSDSATTAVFAPVAIALAASLGHAPEPFVMAVAVAAITATFTPMSHHNLLIYGPGGYRFFDYLKFGGPLTIGVGAIVAILAPLVWRG